LAEHTPGGIKWWNKHVAPLSPPYKLAKSPAELPCKVMGSYDTNRKRVRKKQREAHARRARREEEERRKARRVEGSVAAERQWAEFNGPNPGAAG